jgi:20S proteasome subunit alpha 6
MLGLVCFFANPAPHATYTHFHSRPSQLAGYQEKTFAIDDHIGISISGLTADARYLCKYGVWLV